MAATNFALALILIFAALLLFLENKSRRIGWPPRSFLFIALFLFWAAITAMLARSGFSFTDLGSFSKLWNFLPYIFIPSIAIFADSKTETVLKTAVSVGSLVVLLGIVQYTTGVHYFFEGWFGATELAAGNRFYGFQSHHMHSGGLYTVLFLTASSMALSRDREKIFWSVCSVILACGVLLTGARSYYLGLGAGLTILLVARGWKFLLGGFVLAGLFLISVAAFSPQIKDRIQTIHPLRTDESARQRYNMWKSAFWMVRDHPMAGVGYRRWKDALPEYALRFPDWKMHAAAFGHAHNSYLTVSAETGAVGVTFLLLFWFILLKEEFSVLNLTREYSVARALSLGSIAIIAALLVAAFFEHNLLTATVSLATFFIIGLSRASRIREQLDPMSV